MTAIQALKQVSRAMERDIAALQEKHSDTCTLVIQRLVNDWQRRYPRHKFKAWEAHGILSFDISPKVLGEDAVEYLYKKRGAIGQIGREADEFLAVWNQMDFKLTSSPSKFVIEPTFVVRPK